MQGSIDVRYIGKGAMAWAMLRNLNTSVCASTTPGLQVLAFKRSRKTDRYVHFVHAPTDKAFNKPYSFDHFDTVILNGQHQVNTLRHLENIRRGVAKRLPVCGCVYYDYLLKRADEAGNETSSSANTTVLVAPTWGVNGLLRRYGVLVPEQLLEAGYRVIIRPHPQSSVSEQEMLDDLQNSLKHFADLEWDFSNDPVASMTQADVMVSDISGVIFDYAFLYERPVITIYLDPDKRGQEASDIPYEPWELTVLDTIGRRVLPEQIASIPLLTKQLLTDENLKSGIARLRQEYVANFGQAALATTEEIILEKNQAQQQA